jgi:arylsulfatase
MSLRLLSGLLTLTLSAGFAVPATAQEVLPFPPKPSGSTAARTMQESIYSPLPPVNHLPKDAPNILIVLIDDVGPAQTDAYGGEIHTPTLTKIAKEEFPTIGFTRPRCARQPARRC